jgi:DNA-binding protein H-NS
MAKKLDLKQLLAQQQELAEQIRELQATERQEFKQRVEAEAAELGLSCYEIWGNVKRTKTNKAPRNTNAAKYVDPADPENVYYLARGKKPLWLANYLKLGRKLEDFAA